LNIFSCFNEGISLFLSIGNNFFLFIFNNISNNWDWIITISKNCNDCISNIFSAGISKADWLINEFINSLNCNFLNVVNNIFNIFCWEVVS
jgi:hypothetical protein